MQKVNNFTKKMIINNSITIQCISIAKRQYKQKKQKNKLKKKLNRSDSKKINGQQNKKISQKK